MSYTVIPGDCIEGMRTLPDESIHCCVTSPPYYGLRDYGHEGQIGLEETPAAYVAKMVDVFREVRRVLRKDGTCWLNLGDSYATGTKASRQQSPNPGVGANCPEAQNSVARIGTPDGLKTKDLIGIPWRVAFALQADGWWLRQDIIWHKPNPMPESVTDRCTKAHEYIFLLAKSQTYYYDHEAVKEAAVCGANGSEFHTGKTGEHQMGRSSKTPRKSVARGGFEGKTNAMPGREAFRAIRETRNRRSVWTVTPKPYKGAHFATFPPDLIEPCVLAGCPVGGTILDPFGGSGTTAQVAVTHGRNAVLCELNPAYIELIHRRLATVTPMLIGGAS